MKRGGPLRRGRPMTRTGRLRPVSLKRQRQNRIRSREAIAVFGPDPMCGRPGCTHRARDLHERKTRARGGSITDMTNCVPLCRCCHDEVTFRPTSELAWAYELGLLVHSWEAS